MTPREFLTSAIAMREAIIRKSPERHNTLTCANALRHLKPWLMAYPKATDQQVAAHILRNYVAVQVILPGGNHPAAHTWQERLHTILNLYTYEKQEHTLQKS